MGNDFFNLFIRNFNKLDLKELLEYHGDHPEVSFKAYKNQKVTEIAETVKPLKKIYLDTKFWIEIRDAIYDNGKPKYAIKEIFINLKEKVALGQLICPFSTALFDELLKQGDINKRKRTAQVADILTKNYMVSPLYYLIGCETYNFISAASGRTFYQRNYIWTKALSFLGDINFNIASENYSEENALLMQKTFLDYFYQYTFQEVTAFNDAFHEDSGSAKWHADMLNKYKDIHNITISVEALHKMELFSTLSRAANRMTLSLNQVDLEKQIDQMSLEQIRAIAPFTYCYTLIYASLSRDINRVIKANDYYDISHASLAVGGCDYFFVEKSFATLLKNLKLDQKFNIAIASDHSEILSLIKGIS